MFDNLEILGITKRSVIIAGAASVAVIISTIMISYQAGRQAQCEDLQGVFFAYSERTCRGTGAELNLIDIKSDLMMEKTKNTALNRRLSVAEAENTMIKHKLRVEQVKLDQLKHKNLLRDLIRQELQPRNKE